jgi:hypothetical protein
VLVGVAVRVKVVVGVCVGVGGIRVTLGVGVGVGGIDVGLGLGGMTDSYRTIMSNNALCSPK